MSGYQARSLTIAEAPAHPTYAKDFAARPAKPPQLYIASPPAGAPREPPANPASELALAETRFPILNEDLTPLRQILDTLGLAADYREDAASFGSAVPLLHPNGGCHGYLGVIRSQQPIFAGLGRVLEAALSLAARTIHERWFRLQHHERWVVAAAPVADPSRGLLLALDQQLTVQGMDSRAADWLLDQSTGAKRHRWEDVFRPVTPLPTLRAKADIPLRLTSARDAAPWTAILTGPDLSWGRYSHDAMLHARPRLHGLADLTNGEPEQLLQIPSLTPGMRRKIEEYVEAHLETPLSVERLAGAAGMSCSHFTRAFRNVLKMTPHRYVMWRRLMRAQELIRSSEASLAEIALVTGFSDQSHLCRLFQLHLGETPSRFRRRSR